MAKKRRTPQWWPYRDDPCPERGPALSHVIDGDPRCLYCGSPTKPGSSIVKVETGEDGPVDFTERQMRELEFLQHLYDTGRV